MTRLDEDQAAGLRRLLQQAPPQVVSVVTCGAGAQRWFAGQALTRAQGGRQVRAFDEATAWGNLSDALGLSARFDLLQAVEQHVSLESVCIEAGPGLQLYPAARLAKALAGADRIFAARFTDICRRLQSGADLWLINARPDERFALSPLASAAQRLVIAVDGSPRSITEAYTVIKHLEGGPWLQIDLALGECRRSEEAEALLGNLMRVAQRQTALALRRVHGLEASAAAAAAGAQQESSRFLDRALALARRASRAPLALGA